MYIYIHKHIYIYIHIQLSSIFLRFCQATQLSLSLRQSLSHPGPQWPQSFGASSTNLTSEESFRHGIQDNGEAKVIVDPSIYRARPRGTVPSSTPCHPKPREHSVKKIWW